MTLTLILNIVLSTAVLAAVLGLLVWSIATQCRGLPPLRPSILCPRPVWISKGHRSGRTVPAEPVFLCRTPTTEMGGEPNAA
jgi:hypothetical protein